MMSAFVGLRVERIPCRIRCMCPMMVWLDLGRNFLTALDVRPGNVMNHPLSIAFVHVVIGGAPHVACRKDISLGSVC